MNEFISKRIYLQGQNCDVKKKYEKLTTLKRKLLALVH